MKITQKTLLLAALFAGALAAPASIKNKLGQINAKNLAQFGGGGDLGGGDVPCGCDITAKLDEFELPALPLVECPCVFQDLPGLGASES